MRLGASASWSFIAASGRGARLRDELPAVLGKLKAEGKRIAVYGASSKGSALLNYFRQGRETFAPVVAALPAVASL